MAKSSYYHRKETLRGYSKRIGTGLMVILVMSIITFVWYPETIVGRVIITSFILLLACFVINEYPEWFTVDDDD